MICFAVLVSKSFRYYTFILSGSKCDLTPTFRPYVNIFQFLNFLALKRLKIFVSNKHKMNKIIDGKYKLLKKWKKRFFRPKGISFNRKRKLDGCKNLFNDMFRTNGNWCKRKSFGNENCYVLIFRAVLFFISFKIAVKRETQNQIRC